MNDNQDKQPGQIPEIEGVGLCLRRGRQAKNLEIEQIAGQLRLRQSIIHALENDDLNNLPAPAFTRGYIRSYAAKVGMDSDELVEKYEKMIGSDTKKEILSPVLYREKPSVNFYILTVTIIIAVTLLSLFILSLFDEPAQQTAVVTNIQSETVVKKQQANENVADVGSPAVVISDDTIVAEQATAVLEPEAKKVINEPLVSNEPETGNLTVAIESGAEVKTEIETETVTESDEVDEPVSASENVVPVVSSTGTDQLVLVFTENCWAEVHDSKGVRLLFRMASEGSTHALTGESPFVVLLGNSPAVNITINGEVFDQLIFNRGKVARFFVGG